MVTYHALIATVALLLCVENAFACNGYKAKLKRIVDCGGADQVINIDEGMTVKLTKKCELIPTGCVTTKGFTTAEATYQVMKNGIEIQKGTADVCEVMSHASAEAKNMLKIFAMPDHCPVTEGQICASETTKADLSKYKNLIGMAAGHIQVNATIKHDTGISCFHMEMEITK